MKKLLLFLSLILFSNYLSAQSAPLNMTLHAQWDADTLPTAGSREYNDIWGWVDCEENEYAIMGSAAFVHFFDVTDNSTIIEKGRFEGGSVTTWRDMKTYRDRAYAVSENTTEGLMIFDMSNIQDTIIKTYQSTEFFSSAHNIYIDHENGRLYAVGTNTQSQGVIIFDIETDPDAPIVLGAVNLPGGGYIHDIFVRDNIGYASHGNDGLYIWDFTDPQNPIQMADIVTSGYNHSSWVTDDGNTLIYAEEVPLGLPLGMLDISDLDNGNINPITTFKFPLLAPTHENNVPHNPYIRGDYAVVSHYHDGIQIFDISDPANPTQVAYYDSHANNAYAGYSGCWGVYPFLPSGTIIASDINEGLLLLTADSLDLAPIIPITYPDASLTNNVPIPYCAGELDGFLEVPTGATDYAWIQDGMEVSTDGNTYSPLSSGDFYARVSNFHCTLNSETATIEVSPSPDLSGFSTEPTSYCEGEILSLFGPVGQDSYTWFQNGNIVQDGGMVFNVPGPGSYSLMVELGPCSATSDEIEITVDQLPATDITASGDGVVQDGDNATFCENQTAILEVPNSMDASYAWTKDQVAVGTNSNQLEVTEAGTYNVVVTGANGCMNSSIDFAITVIPASTSISFMNGELSSNTADANSYQWFLDGVLIENATAINFSPVQSGDYYCEIVTSEGCLAVSNTLMVTISSNNTIENLSLISLFPNPTDGQLVLNLDVSEAMDLSIQIIHIDGRVLQTFSKSVMGNVNIPIDLTNHAAGIYMIQLENKQGVMTQKIVKL